jgi:hypothetical protein
MERNEPELSKYLLLEKEVYPTNLSDKSGLVRVLVPLLLDLDLLGKILIWLPRDLGTICSVKDKVSLIA